MCFLKTSKVIPLSQYKSKVALTARVPHMHQGTTLLAYMREAHELSQLQYGFTLSLDGCQSILTDLYIYLAPSLSLSLYLSLSLAL